MEEVNNEVEESEVEETEVDDTEVENDDSSNVEENETPEENDEAEAFKAKVAELEAKNKQLYERTKKVQSKSNKPSVDPRGMVADVNAISGQPDEVVNAMERIVRADGVSYSEAKKDPTIVALMEKLERETKSANAGLGASGKGIQSSEANYVPNQERDEHKKAWEEAMKG